MNSIVIFKDTTINPASINARVKYNKRPERMTHADNYVEMQAKPVAVGMSNFRAVLRQARANGTVPVGKPSKVASQSTLAYLARQERRKAKASGKMVQPKGRKAKVVETQSQTIQVKGPDLYTLCTMIEAGKLPVTALSPWLGGNVTSDTIQEWYLREQSARNLAEIRVANGGKAIF